MVSNLRVALGLDKIPRVALVGSGGKTTALFRLARDYSSPVIVTATSHLELFQTRYADNHFYLDDAPISLMQFPEQIRGVTLFSGPKNSRSVIGLGTDSIQQVLSYADAINAPLLIEADGSRRHPLKAPAAHEPPIPDFVNTVVVVIGLSALGKPFSEVYVHRPEIFASLSGLQQGEEISIGALEHVLCHPLGGLKNIPTHANRIALLNQADTPELFEKASELAEKLLPTYHTVVISSLKDKKFYSIHSRPSRFADNKIHNDGIFK